MTAIMEAGRKTLKDIVMTRLTRFSMEIHLHIGILTDFVRCGLEQDGRMLIQEGMSFCMGKAIILDGKKENSYLKENVNQTRKKDL